MNLDIQGVHMPVAKDTREYLEKKLHRFVTWTTRSST